ncbi:sortase [Candidatus Berkelbacteria bacterium]|nr:sortase [Candidatus Berkelbacteria bacterium]
MNGAVLRTFLTFLAAGLVAYSVLTAPTYWKRFQYWREHRGAPNIAERVIATDLEGNSFSAAVGAALTQPTFAKAPLEETPKEQVSTVETLELGENILLVPKIKARAPIVWRSSSDEKIMLENLQSGVAHYGFTALPNEETGNVFITGHSSYYWWDKGKYKTVFALLDKLVAGDQALIQFENKVYVYEVRDSVVVKPADVSVTDATEKPILSLMTCVPVGTSLNRLIVRFDLKRVYPAESGVITAPASVESDLPSAVPAEQSEDYVPTERDIIKLIPGL